MEILFSYISFIYKFIRSLCPYKPVFWNGINNLVWEDIF